jgi:hypothetical protein
MRAPCDELAGRVRGRSRLGAARLDDGGGDDQ